MFDMDTLSVRPTPGHAESPRQPVRTGSLLTLTCWPRLGGQPPIEAAAAIFDQFAGEIECNSGVQARNDFVRKLRDDIRHIPEFTVFRASATENLPVAGHSMSGSWRP